MTRSASERPETLNATGAPALIINRDPVGYLLVADDISQLASYGVLIGPGESFTYDLTQDRALMASPLNQPGGATTNLSVLYDLLPGGSGFDADDTTPNALYLGEVTAPNGVNPLVKFKVPGGVTAVGVFTQQAGGPASITVTGDVTGWVSIKEAIPTSSMGYFQGLIVPEADENLLVQMVNSSGFTLSVFVVGYLSEPPLSEPHSAHTGAAGGGISVPSGTPTVVLSAPSPGLIWEIAAFTFAAAAAATGASQITVKGSTSGNAYGIWGVLTGGMPAGGLPLGGPLEINEGLTVAQSSGVAVTAVTDARLITPT